jgi:arylsulfatase A-like enzyme
MLMTDDTGWNDFGAYTGGGAAPGHPTPNIDRIAKEGALFTSWYGQASCTAGRASFITGRIPIRSALSVVTVPGDLNGLRKETPTIAEFFKKNRYGTYFSGKWHLGDKRVLPNRARLRRNERVRRLLSGCLRLQRYVTHGAPVVPEIQRRILEDVSERRESI